MRLSKRLVVLAVLCIGGLALAQYTALETVHRLFKAGLTIGSTGQKIDDSYAATAVFDFPSAANVCDLSGDVALTGAAVGDVCTVNRDVVEDEDSWFRCYVKSAGVVVMKHCAHGTVDPADAGYSLRTFDP